jgi:hypothetical protein
MLKHLRITVSAVFGILCVLLIALWVRSYWYQDCFNGWLTRHQLSFISGRGWMMAQWDWHNFQLYGWAELRGSEFTACYAEEWTEKKLQ